MAPVSKCSRARSSTPPPCPSATPAKHATAISGTRRAGSLRTAAMISGTTVRGRPGVTAGGGPEARAAEGDLVDLRLRRGVGQSEGRAQAGAALGRGGAALDEHVAARQTDARDGVGRVEV